MSGGILAVTPRASHDAIDEIGGIECDSLYAAEIDQTDSAILLKQIIPRVMIGMDSFQFVELKVVKLDQVRAN